MRFYRCKCGDHTAWSSMGVADCLTCKKCGSDLAEGPSGHSDSPTPHDYVTKYNQDTGVPYERCDRCMQTRADIEAPPEPEPEPEPRDAADDYYAAVKGLVSQFPHCDAAVLRRAEDCEYCALPKNRPLHEWRQRNGVNYTGENDPTKRPCPAESVRPTSTIHRWPGNRPKPRA